jgi:hypothetical protein
MWSSGSEQKLVGWPLTSWETERLLRSVRPSHRDPYHQASRPSSGHLQNGETVIQGKAFIKNPDQPLGSHVFILSGLDNGQQGLAWHAIGHHPTDTNGATAPDDAVIMRVHAEPLVVEAMKQGMHEGLVLVLTDLPSQPDTRTGKDFVILNEDIS